MNSNTVQRPNSTAMYININPLVCFIFKIHVFVKPHKVSSSHDYVQTKSISETIGEHHDGNHTMQISYANQLHFHHHKESISEINSCQYVQGHDDLFDNSNKDESSHGDTIGQDDLVQSQYALLPYPPVREDDLFDEQLYYDGDSGNIPYTIHSSMALESINHFLFNGSNDFL